MTRAEIHSPSVVRPSFQQGEFIEEASLESPAEKSRPPILRVVLSPGRYLEKRIRRLRKTIFGSPQNKTGHGTPHRRVA